MWFKPLSKMFRKNKPIKNKLSRKARLLIEALEDRVTPSTITQWNFENDVIAVNNSPAPSTGTGTATPLGMTNSYNSTTSVTTADVTAGASGDAGTNTLDDLTQIWRVRGQNPGNGWSSQAPIATQGAELAASTVNFAAPITVSFDWYATNQGEANLQLEYTTDGSTWHNIAVTVPGADADVAAKTNSSSSNTVMGSYVQMSGGQQWAPNLTAAISDPAAANNPNFAIEMVNASTGADCIAAIGTPLNNSSGNWRFDNITISGTLGANTVKTTNAVTAAPASPQNPGTNVTLTDAITPASGSTNPAGTVDFFDGNSQIGTTQTVTNGSGTTGTAAITINSLALGAHSQIHAVYTPTGDFLTSTSPNISYTIGDPTSSLVTDSPASPQQVGTNVTFTDTIAPANTGGTNGDGTPTGTVQFFDNGIALGSVQTVVAGAGATGTATVSTSALTSGTDNITAVYTPTGNFLGSTSPAAPYALYSGTPGQFTPGNLVLLQAGDGVNQYNAQGPLFLDEITTGGANVQQAAIPATGGVGNASNQPITIDLSSAAGNGQLNRSYDGSALSFDGVDSTINNGGLTAPATPTGQDDRVVAVVTGDPTIPSDINTATHGQFYVGDDNRGSVAESPTGPIYTAGHPNQAGGAVSQGVHEFDTEGPSIGTQVSASTNIRGVTIGFDNRMYFSTASGLGGAAALNTAGIFTEAQALPTSATPTPLNDIQVVPAIFGASKLGGVYLADMNGDGIIDNGDRLYFVDDGTVGGAGTGGLYVSTWNDSNTANPWNTPNNAAAAAAGITNHWSVPVRLGDAPVQAGSGGVGQLRGLTGTVISPTQATLYTTAYDNSANDSSYVQQWVDANTGVAIANAMITTGTTVQITTLTPNTFTTGQVVEVDGVGANNGAGAISSGYNGAWAITVIDSTHFTYNDTNTGAGSLLAVNNQGAADVTVNATTVQTLAAGSDILGGKAVGDVGLRGVAFAPVAATSVSLAQSPANPLSPGTALTLTATLTNAQVTPSGQVAFIDENTNAVLGFGTISTTAGVTTATLNLQAGVVGNHYIKAYFGGGGTAALASANSNTIQVIEAGSTVSVTSVVSNLPAVAVAKQVTLTATVTSGATGTVSFFNGAVALANLIGTATISGTTATLTTAFGTAGTEIINAVYNGDNTYASSQGATTVNVAANATATTTASANNVAVGSIQTYTATINGNATLGTPIGSVVFSIISATTNTSGKPLVTASSSAITLVAGPNNTATAVWTGPALTAAGSYFVTISYSATGATNPYSYLAINTTSATSGVALVETAKQAFTPGNLVAVQRGDGTVNLGSSAYPVFLDEYTPTGALVQSIALPNVDAGTQHALFLSGQNGSEGLLNRSANGYDLTLAGYDLPAGHTFVTSTFPYQFPRTIAEVNGSGSVDTSTAISTTQAIITAASELGTTVTITTSKAHGFTVGQKVVVTGITPVGYDGQVTLLTASGSSFTYTAASVLGTPTLSNAAATASAVPYNPLDVVTNDGNEFWLASNLPTGDTTDSGILYVGGVGATSATQIGASNTGAASIEIAGGQLYIAKPSGDVQTVGTGLPTTAGQSLVGLPNLLTAYNNFFPNAENPEQILLLNTNDGTSNNPNVAYIADQANGILKFWFDGTNWQYGGPGGIFGQKLVFSGGATGVAGYVVNPGPNAQVQLYVTGSNVQQQNPNQIDSFLDTNGAPGTAGAPGTVSVGFPSGNVTNLGFVGGATSGGSPNGNENFAGLAFVPGYITDTTLSQTGTSAAGYTFTATVTTPSAPSNVPTGQVYFYLDGVLQTQTAGWTVNGSGHATFTIGAGLLKAGTSHMVTALYQGDVKDGTSTGVISWADPSFTPGNLIATVVGSGSGSLAGNGTATFLNEYPTAGGAAVQTIALPVGGTNPFTEGGTSTTQGYLTDSADGHTATIAGYEAAAGSTTSGVNREIGIISPNGTVETSTQIAAADTGSSVKATVSADGLGIWVATANYVRYVPFGNNALTGTTAVTNWLQSPSAVAIGTDESGGAGGLLFDGGAGSQANGIGNVDGPVQISGPGLPDVGGQSGNIYGGFPSARDAFNNFPTSNQIAISPDGNTIFVADSRTDTAGGILEFFQTIPGTWTEVGHSQVDATADGGLRALTAVFTSGGTPSVTLYGTTTNSSANRIVQITGGTLDGSAPSFSFTTVETAAANTAFRGVALAPAAPAASAAATSLTVSGSPGSYPGTVQLQASVTSAVGTPTGYVSFQTPQDVEIGSAPLVGGVATLVPRGDLQVAYSGTINAVYMGDANIGPSSGSASATVTTGGTTTALTSQFTNVATGVADALTAQVTYTGEPALPNAAPTGTVTFWQDAVGAAGINLGSVPVVQTIVNVAGTPTIEYLATGVSDTFSSTGVHHVFAVYSGDSNFQVSQGAQDITVVLPSTTVVTTSNANPGPSGASVTLTATVSGTGGTPTGTVQFYDDLLPIGGSLTLSGGVASVTETTALLQAANKLTPGLHSITAVYSGDPVYFTSAGVYEQSVQTQAFGASDEFVYRTGDGTTALIAQPPNPNANNGPIGNTIYVDEYTPAGSLVQSIIMPSADGTGVQSTIHAVVGNGQQSSTGQLTLSADGQYLFLAGYDATPLAAAAAPLLSSNTVPRSVARIKYDGTIQTEAFASGTSGVLTAGNINGIYSPDGNQFYLSGAGSSSGANGVVYLSSFAPSAGLVSATATITGNPGFTVTGLESQSGNLVAVGASSNLIQQYTGNPTAAATLAALPGVSATTDPNQTFTIDAYFTHLDGAGAPAGINTMYLSDDGPSFANGSITKWALVRGTWTLVDTVTAGTGNTAVSFYWLAGQTDGTGNVTLYSTYGQGGNSPPSSSAFGALYSIKDTNGYDARIGTGGIHSDAVTTVASVTGATSLQEWRGVALAPKPAASIPQFIITTVGGNAVTAGGAFIVIAQAADQFGNPLSNFSGPVTFTTTDPQVATLAGATATNGFAVTLGTLKTVTGGPWNITATAGTLKGTSGPLTVSPASASYFTVAAPLTAITNTSFPITVTAFDSFHNVATDYAGTVKLSSTDNAAAMAGDLGGSYTFTTGAGKDNGVHVFNVQLLTNGTQTITAADVNANAPPIVGTSGTSAVSGLRPTLAATPTGFKISFNEAVNPKDVTLYGAAGAVDDVTLVGANGNGPGVPLNYPGTLVFSADDKSATFNVTGSFLAASHAGATATLPDDSYSVTLVSAAVPNGNGFQDINGQGMDPSVVTDGQFTGTFSTTFSASPMLGILDFARGPNASGDTTTLIKVPNNPANGGHVGIPASIYNASGLKSAGFTVTYNSQILTITGGIADPTNVGASFTMTGTPVLQADGIHSVATFAYTNATAVSGAAVLGDITAFVPNSAKSLYQVKDLMSLGGITVTGGGTVLAGTGVDVNAYFAAVDGTHAITGVDKGLIDAVAKGNASGFPAFRLLDPAIIGDVANDNSVTGNSTSLLTKFFKPLPVAEIPTPANAGVYTSPDSADPIVSLPATVQPTSTGVVNVPVLLDHARPQGSTGLVEAELTVEYDPAVLSVSAADVTLGSLPSQGTGWQLSATVNAATGQISIQLYSQTPITTDQAGSLVNIAFHAKAGTGLGSTTVQLPDSKTVLADTQAAMILKPGLDWTSVLTGDWVQSLLQ